MSLLIVVLIGLAIGSFLNVLIARYEELETVIATRSHCPHCKKTIAAYDLIPLLSFVLLLGRCRYCKEKISWQYPLVELLTALVAGQLFLTHGFSILTFLLFATFALLIVIAVIDLRNYVVPDEFMLPAVGLALIARFINSETATASSLSVLVGGGILAILVFAGRGRWMGFGDIGLGVVLGLLTGLLSTVTGLVIAFFAGSIVGLSLLMRQRKTLKETIPFGPYLVFGTYIATIWGDYLTAWYLKTIGYY